MRGTLNTDVSLTTIGPVNNDSSRLTITATRPGQDSQRLAQFGLVTLGANKCRYLGLPILELGAKLYVWTDSDLPYC